MDNQLEKNLLSRKGQKFPKAMKFLSELTKAESIVDSNTKALAQQVIHRWFNQSPKGFD